MPSCLCAFIFKSLSVSSPNCGCANNSVAQIKKKVSGHLCLHLILWVLGQGGIPMNYNPGVWSSETTGPSPLRMCPHQSLYFLNSIKTGTNYKKKNNELSFTKPSNLLSWELGKMDVWNFRVKSFVQRRNDSAAVGIYRR